MCGECDETNQEQVMSDFKDKAKEKIDAAAGAAKRTINKVVDKSKDVAHMAGKKMVQEGKRLQSIPRTLTDVDVRGLLPKVGIFDSGCLNGCQKVG